MKLNNNSIIIVSGEPYSVFFELFFKTLTNKEIKNYNKPLILIGSKNLLIKQMRKLKYSFKIRVIDENLINKIKLDNKKINLIDVKFNFKKTFDKISIKSSNYIENCFSKGIQLIKKKIGIALINGPISKKHFLNKKFPGVTEYLGSKFNKKEHEVMLIYNEKLSVSPITTHLPLKDVSKKITKKKIIHNVKLINNFYIKKLNFKPRFAVTGLNPHCETHKKFNEEDKIIKPAIKHLFNKKIFIDGPFPADTIFLKKNLKKYDVIIGMYHDQVLTPIKTIFGFNAINVTLGLPIIRISPDHGPNNQMLGKNKSNPQSLKKALNFLKKICAN